MPLKLTLKANERIVVNGCVIRNSNRRHVLTIESQADVVRGFDLLDESAMSTPVGRAYFLIQTALTRPETREKIVPVVQGDLATLVTVMGNATRAHVFEAANYVSIGDFYKALRALRPVLKREAELLAFAAAQAGGDTAPGAPMAPAGAGGPDGAPEPVGADAGDWAGNDNTGGRGEGGNA
ncbi:hypothetical protein BV394_05305 [Brevirhabdus pacifica]|uniref:Uncharacterized protein n=1 Tax=Brevirhabdus pacifica TaxID=1267768 RepID=A0A1U7DH37_9RHOB|nr:flagellar biosynthesis repressor FlbT [Brevirhabdus pacifica]APX89203.1 hypothetical protein BV394_05305 [Brevirhabdus pacifica]PJJ86194.1 flagellar protein FlbT [Brevirhabdus pacifica]